MPQQEYFSIKLPLLSERACSPPNNEIHEQNLRELRLPHDLEIVLPNSAKAARRAVWTCARFFKREFDYDAVQYGHEGDEDEAHAYLWTTNNEDAKTTQLVLGACCFRWRAWTNVPACWCLEWVWLHPFQRHRGHLTSAWAYFKKRYGEFYPMPPLSSAMQNFLEKQKKHAIKDTATQEYP